MMEAKFPVLVQIAIICKGLSSDHRYKDDTKDILSKGYDNISEVSALLAKRAIELNNVSSSFKPQEANYNSSVASKQKNRSSKPKACWWHALGICEYGEKCRMRHKGVQRSQVPENWLKNNSKRIDALQKQKPNKTDSWHDSNTNVPDKGKSEQKRSDKDKNKSKICFIFEQNGSCPKGDKCRYSHETTQEEHMTNLVIKTDYQVGDLVTLTNYKGDYIAYNGIVMTVSALPGEQHYVLESKGACLEAESINFQPKENGDSLKEHHESHNSALYTVSNENNEFNSYSEFEMARAIIDNGSTCSIVTRHDMFVPGTMKPCTANVGTSKRVQNLCVLNGMVP